MIIKKCECCRKKLPDAFSSQKYCNNCSIFVHKLNVKYLEKMKRLKILEVRESERKNQEIIKNVLSEKGVSK